MCLTFGALFLTRNPAIAHGIKKFRSQPRFFRARIAYFYECEKRRLHGCEPEGANRPPPDPKDHSGWQRTVAENLHLEYDAQVLFCALQGLGAKANVLVRDALADRLSRLVIAILRRQVSSYHPNEGWDIIWRAHEFVFMAAAKPNSKDGDGFREAFHTRLSYRHPGCYCEIREKCALTLC